jgi:hypothetical protein
MPHSQLAPRNSTNDRRLCIQLIPRSVFAPRESAGFRELEVKNLCLCVPFGGRLLGKVFQKELNVLKT